MNFGIMKFPLFGITQKSNYIIVIQINDSSLKSKLI